MGIVEANQILHAMTDKAETDSQVTMFSRDNLYNASHPETGLFSEYAAFDGIPQITKFNDISHKLRCPLRDW
jgi:hypothetical protein